MQLLGMLNRRIDAGQYAALQCSVPTSRHALVLVASHLLWSETSAIVPAALSKHQHATCRLCQICTVCEYICRMLANTPSKASMAHIALFQSPLRL